MKNMSVREKVMLGILGLLCVALAYYYLVYVPMKDETERYRQDYATVDTTLITVEARVAKMEQMKAEIEEIKAAGTSGIKELPKYDNRQSLMNQLSLILAKTKEYDSRFGKVASDGTVISREVTLDYSCEDYASAKGILQELYTGGYPCSLGNMQFGKDGMDVTVYITYYEYGKVEQPTE